MKSARQQQIESPLVLLEIGGNDLFGMRSPAQFTLDLEALLAYVCAPGRQVAMFELPLPPLNHEYGRIQRTLAAKYHVTLIPKRILLSVLAPSDATVDTIHLTHSGHQRMAAAVWQVVEPAFAED